MNALTYTPMSVNHSPVPTIIPCFLPSIQVRASLDFGSLVIMDLSALPHVVLNDKAHLQVMIMLQLSWSLQLGEAIDSVSLSRQFTFSIRLILTQSVNRERRCLESLDINILSRWLVVARVS